MAGPYNAYLEDAGDESDYCPSIAPEIASKGPKPDQPVKSLSTGTPSRAYAPDTTDEDDSSKYRESQDDDSLKTSSTGSSSAGSPTEDSFAFFDASNDLQFLETLTTALEAIPVLDQKVEHPDPLPFPFESSTDIQSLYQTKATARSSTSKSSSPYMDMLKKALKILIIACMVQCTLLFLGIDSHPTTALLMVVGTCMRLLGGAVTLCRSDVIVGSGLIIAGYIPYLRVFGTA